MTDRPERFGAGGGRRRLRVWAITPELHRHGGTERSVWEHLARWRDTFGLRVYTTSAADHAPDGVTVRRVGALPSPPAPHLAFWASWVAVGRVRRAVDALVSGRADAVVSPGVNAADADVVGVHLLFARLVEAAGTAAPAAGAMRSWHRRAYFAAVGALERRVYGGPASLYAVSGRDAREIERRFGRPAGSVPVVPHGVDPAAFSAERRLAGRDRSRQALGLGNRKLALLVGNEPTVKGVDLAIAALAALPDDVLLAIAGRADRSQVRRWADDAGVADRVLVLEYVDDPMERYAAADVAIAPSRQDSFNLPALEALACGLPLVASDAVGLAEHLEGCDDATVLASPVDPPALAEAVAAALAREPDGSGEALAGSMSWDASAAAAADVVRRETSTPRVLVLATDAARTGGIQRATRTLARAFADGFGPERVGVLSVWRGEADVPGRTLRAGDRLEGDARVGAVRSGRFALDAAATAWRWRRRLAIVASHPHLGPVAWLARAVSRAPYAVWCHGIEVWGPIDPLVRASIARADRVFAPSRFTAAQVEARAGLPAGTVRVVPHCVPPELVPGGRPSDAGPVLTVARLHPRHAYKGVDTLLEAWPKVVAVSPDARLLVIGDGPDRDRLTRRAGDLGVVDRVTFAGRVADDELAAAYASASVFAMPARHRVGPGAQGEGFGLVYVEAGARGLPVVAGAGSGADDAVEHEVSGLLVDPHDADAIAEAIVRLLGDRALAERLGAGGRRLAETRFSYERFRDTVDDLVRSMPIRRLVR